MSWRDLAECKHQPELMFNPRHRVDALRLCTQCPVITECREYASRDTLLLNTPEYWAVVGGTTTIQLRRDRMAARKRARKGAA